MSDNPSYKKCVEILNKYRHEIEKIPNFHFVDVGLKIVEGSISNEYAIRIFVHGSKLNEERVGVKFFTHDIDGLRTDILSTYKFISDCEVAPELQRVSEVSPIKGGISIGPFEDLATLGTVMNSSKYGLCAISTFHGQYVGKDIFQPSPQEKHIEYRKIGKIETHYYPLDISIISLQDSPVQSEILDLVKPTGIADWDQIEKFHFDRETVFKSGRSTAITKGFISGLDPASHSITISPLDSLEILSCKGDSGSIWLSEEGMILGVHREGSNGSQGEAFAIASSLHLLVDHWGLSIYNELV